MKKTTNFDAFAQFADAQLSKEEMKNIKGGAEWEGGDPGTGGGGTGGGNVGFGTWNCYHDTSYHGGSEGCLGNTAVKIVQIEGDDEAVRHCDITSSTCLGCEPA